MSELLKKKRSLVDRAHVGLERTLHASWRRQVVDGRNDVHHPQWSVRAAYHWTASLSQRTERLGSRTDTSRFSAVSHLKRGIISAASRAIDRWCIDQGLRKS